MFVSNIPHDVKEDQLKEIFSEVRWVLLSPCSVGWEIFAVENFRGFLNSVYYAMFRDFYFRG